MGAASTVGIAVALALQGIIGGLQGATHSTLGLEALRRPTNAAVDVKSFTEFSRVGAASLGQPNRFRHLRERVGIFTLLAMILWANVRRGRIGYVVIFCMAPGALIMTQSRGGWLGFAFAFMPFASPRAAREDSASSSVFTDRGCIPRCFGSRSSSSRSRRSTSG